MKKILTLILLFITITFTFQNSALAKAQEIENTSNLSINYSSEEPPQYSTYESMIEDNAYYSKEIAATDIYGVKENLFYTQYKIKVKFFGSSMAGEIKLAITPASGALNNDASNLDKYENIYNTSSPNFTFNTFSKKGYVRLFTYTPLEKADYTIETEGNIDTYIYLVDPRSTYLLTSTEYNDDAGEGLNASIKKELSKNIPYLIIYSRYNLNGEDTNFTLRIYKN